MSFATQLVNTQDVDAVIDAVTPIYQSLFPEADPDFISQSYHDVKGMFDGHYLHYQPIDTFYHDLEHTFQASLCMVDLLSQYMASGDEPRLTQEDFQLGLLAILLHDTGYLKEQGDDKGTGAKYTFSHEARSCLIAESYLKSKGWSEVCQQGVKNLISCTGPRANLTRIAFRNDTERFLGYVVCTSDYLGQMSDPQYVEKLPALFQEFQESDDFNQIPEEERCFKSEAELYAKTPLFWEACVMPKLTIACKGVWRYLAEPYPGGPNPYIERVEENLARIKTLTLERSRDC